MRAKAIIISIGDEILYGQTLDTNSHWISGELDKVGIKVLKKLTIADNRNEILESFKQAKEEADIVLITGGLGPTTDDLTKPLLAEFFGVSMVMNEDALEEVTQLFARSGREMSEANRGQAELPSNCTKITNSLGTAPGMWFDEENIIFIAMPGVPYEMKRMMELTLLPKLVERYVDGVIYHKVIKTIGIPESKLAAKIAEVADNLPDTIKLAYLPSYGQVKLRLTSTGPDFQQLKFETDKVVKAMLPLIETYVYGYDDDEIEAVIGSLLMDRNCTLGTAESCTGGNVAALITSVAGSSRYYQGSIISYDNRIKIEQLNVNKELIHSHGAVSEEVVCQMANGVRERLGVDIGLATSGIAGPDGGTADKPVGTIWIAYADKDKTIAKKLQLTKDRKLNITFTSYALLNLLRLNIFSI
ncbi:MAG: nicotinamide-nucleotide amidase [Cyclobacteriaceae bacterium]|jgi:nicotinamide-nucleotide amidase